jgi:hypothetical protein
VTAAAANEGSSEIMHLPGRSEARFIEQLRPFLAGIALAFAQLQDTDMKNGEARPTITELTHGIEQEAKKCPEARA